MHHTDTNPKPPSGAPADHAQPSGLATVSGLVGRRVPDAGDGPTSGLHGQFAAAAGRAPAAQSYWRSSYASEPYYEPGRSYEDYAPAYELGASSRAGMSDSVRDFAAAEPDMQRAWEARRAGSSLTWEQARAAMRAAWHRVDVDLSDVAPR